LVWDIKVLYFGHLTSRKGNNTPGYDDDLVLDTPYLGFLLRNGKENVLVDTGIHERFFSGGEAWGGGTAVGGASYVVEALAKEGLKCEDIDTVIYTHLHNDHAGNCDLFPDALAIWQKDEMLNLLNPVPSQLLRRDYDLEAVGPLKALKNVCEIDGDVELPNGLKLIKTPSHTLGHMSVWVPTNDGPRVLVGDFCSRSYFLFPEMDELLQADGSVVKITPLPHDVSPIYPHTLVYDHFAFYDSYYKIKSLIPAWEQKYLVCGHDSALLYTGVL
jgi:N-acyl homoserine lactone hydrolase